jgi:hypothetical protein
MLIENIQIIQNINWSDICIFFVDPKGKMQILCKNIPIKASVCFIVYRGRSLVFLV